MLNVVATAAASCELSSGGEENTNKANLTNSVPAFSSKLKKNYKLQSANNFIQQQHIQTKNLPVLSTASHQSTGKSYIFLLSQLFIIRFEFFSACCCLCFINANNIIIIKVEQNFRDFSVEFLILVTR